jgi:hypothetical protein
MAAGKRTKPIGAAGGRDWGLPIADWGFEDAGPELFVWTECETKPIWPGFTPPWGPGKSEIQSTNSETNPNVK